MSLNVRVCGYLLRGLSRVIPRLQPNALASSDVAGAGGSVAGFTDGWRNLHALLYSLVSNRHRQVCEYTMPWKSLAAALSITKLTLDCVPGSCLLL